MERINFEKVKMVREWKGLKHGDVATLDVLAITQAMEFAAHAGAVLEGEIDGLKNRDDAPHLFDAVDKCRECIANLSHVLDCADELGLDAKLKRCAEHIAFTLKGDDTSSRAQATRKLVYMAHGEDVDVSAIPTREQDLASEVSSD